MLEFVSNKSKLLMMAAAAAAVVLTGLMLVDIISL